LKEARWRLRRTRRVMEKLGECGLKLRGDEGHQDRAIDRDG
jgi:hypothetical protein